MIKIIDDIREELKNSPYIQDISDMLNACEQVFFDRAMLTLVFTRYGMGEYDPESNKFPLSAFDLIRSEYYEPQYIYESFDEFKVRFSELKEPNDYYPFRCIMKKTRII
jgi:hypothetical protein